jgi:hypothetical protein
MTCLPLFLAAGLRRLADNILSDAAEFGESRQLSRSALGEPDFALRKIDIPDCFVFLDSEFSRIIVLRGCGYIPRT